MQEDFVNKIPNNNQERDYDRQYCDLIKDDKNILYLKYTLYYKN